MSLGEDLERNISEAWLRLWPWIKRNPDELRRRLARRRMKSLNRPARPWCIAIRASDRRITAAHWVIWPEHAMDLDHPEHPYEPIEHAVTIQKHAIRRYCNPVSFSIADAADVAEMLGVSPATLMRARKEGVFHENYRKGSGGKRGAMVPLLSPRGELLDPCVRGFYAAPHPLYRPLWEFLSRRFPDDFEQTVIRRPVFGRLSPVNDGQLRGYVWLCPGCKKQVRTIYYPVAIPSLFDCWFKDPVIKLGLCDADLPQPPAGSFACAECHQVMFISTISEGCWNHFISRMTAGLLYGHEVPKPCSFVPQRKRARIRMLDRAAPIQRKVLTRLSNGWSNQKIARDLGISIITVRCHTYRICRQENVADVQALAKKLNFAIAPPLTMAQRARLRRAQVQQLLLAGLTNRQIAKELDLMPITVNFDTYAIYKAHGIHGLNNKARRAFAEKLGVTLAATRVEQLRARTAELREQGLTWARIAIELEVSYATVAAYAKKIREAKRQLAENADVEAGVLRSG